MICEEVCPLPSRTTSAKACCARSRTTIIASVTRGIFCAEVVDEESGFAANVGGEGAKRKVRDAVVQNVFDGSVEEIKTALGLGSFHVTTVT